MTEPTRVDGTSQSVLAVNTTSITLTNYTWAGGEPFPCLVVRVGGEQNDSLGNTPVVSSITYNGVQLTRAVEMLKQDNGAVVTLLASLWYLKNPPVVTANVVCTLTGNITNGIGLNAIVFRNVDPVLVPFGIGYNGEDDTSPTATEALNPAFSTVITTFCTGTDLGSISVVAPQVEDFNVTPSSCVLGGSHLVGGAGPQQVNAAWNCPANNRQVIVYASFPGVRELSFWGDTNVELYFRSAADANWARYMGGNFPAQPGPIRLTAVLILTFGIHVGQIRLAVYEGGNSVSGPVGATLVEDLGTTSGTATNTYLRINSVTKPVLNSGAVHWLAFKASGSNIDIGFGGVPNGNRIVTDGKAGNFFSPLIGRWDSTGENIDENSAWSNVCPAGGSFNANANYAIVMEFENVPPETTGAGLVNAGILTERPRLIG